MEGEQEQKICKVIIIGDSGTGKSSIMLRTCDDTFSESYLPTIGVDFKIKKYPIRNLKLQLWDTAGQERFRTITASYYKGSDIIVIVYDITDRQSFSNLEKWYQEVKKYASESAAENCLIIVGSKSDLNGKREVTITEGEEFANSKRAMHMEYSARDSSPEIFSDKILELYDKISL